LETKKVGGRLTMEPITFPPGIQNLIMGGVITVGVHVTRDGKEMFARSVLPHPKLGITTACSFTLEEAIKAFAKVAHSHKNYVVADAPPPSKESGAAPATKITSLLAAMNLSNERRLDEVTKHGVKNSLPINSLTWTDLMRDNTDDLSARAILVANKIGSTKIAARISTDPAKFGAGRVKNLNDWWEVATPEQKFGVLTTHSKAGSAPIGSHFGKLSERFARRVHKVPNPFRDINVPLDNTEENSSDEESPLEDAEGVLIWG